ncbi:MAG TPA: hypothetical protein VEX68_21665 [Bryobacteraceae bacterium]|nr:hypothetical protein [Bryobacteraceae bacterium]
MFRHPLFGLYGLLLIGASSVASYRGFSFTDVNTVQGVPKSVRDNPGVYRAIYSSYHRYSGGK